MHPVASKSGKAAPPLPDGGWGWMVVAATWFINLSIHGFGSCIGLLAKPMMEEFQVSNKMGSVILSVHEGLFYGTGKLAAFLCKKFGYRITAIIGVVVTMIGSALSYYATNIWVMYFTVGVVMGVGCGILYFLSTAILGMYFKKRISRAMGISASGAGFGTVSFSYVYALLISSIGWRWVFVALLPVFCLCAVCATTFAPLKSAPGVEENKDNKEIQGQEVSQPMDIGEQRNGTKPLLSKRLLIYVISNFLTSAAYHSVLYFLPVHAANIGLDPNEESRMLFVYGISNTIMRILVGIVADHKLPLPRGLGADTARNRLWIYLISLASCGILISFCFVFTGYYSLAIFSGLFGVLIAADQSLTPVILVDIVDPEKRMEALSVLFLFQGVATVVGPVVCGILADLTGGFTLPFALCGVCLFVSGIMIVGIHLLQQREARARAPAIRMSELDDTQ